MRQTCGPTLAGIAAPRDVGAACSREPFVIYKIDLASLAPAFISKLLDHPHPRPAWLLASLKSRCNLPGRTRSIAALRPRLSFHSFPSHSCSWRLPPLTQPDFPIGRATPPLKSQKYSGHRSNRRKPAKINANFTGTGFVQPVRAPTACGISVRKAAERFVAGVRECRI